MNGIRGWLGTAAAGALLAAGGTGCAGYRLGSMLPPGIRTVHVSAIENATGEPLLEAEVLRAVHAQLQFDGSLRLSDAAGSDSQLRIRLTSFRADPIGYRAEQDATPDEYRIRLAADFALIDRRTGAVVTESRAVGEATYDAAGDLTRARRDSIPAASRDLARRLVSQLVEAW